jgi:hypothetical protein
VTKQLWTLLLVTRALAQGQILSPAWVELGEGGRAIARVVTQSEDCPTLQLDGANRAMVVRQPLWPVAENGSVLNFYPGLIDL